MFAGLRQALVLSCSECDFWKHWTHSFRGCSTAVAEVEMYPYTFAPSRSLSIARRDLLSLDFIVNKFFYEIFLNKMSVIGYSQEMFHFELSSITLQRRYEKLKLNIAMLRLF